MAKYTLTQAQQEIGTLRADMSAMNEKLDQLIAMMSAQQKPTPQKAAKKAEAPKEMVTFTKKDGTTVQCTAAQAEAWEKWRSKELSDAQKGRLDAIQKSKASEPARTRELEKRLGVPEGSFESTACTLEQAVTAGWKGTRKQLKDIKTQIRAEM